MIKSKNIFKILMVFISFISFVQITKGEIVYDKELNVEIMDVDFYTSTKSKFKHHKSVSKLNKKYCK